MSEDSTLLSDDATGNTNASSTGAEGTSTNGEGNKTPPPNGEGQKQTEGQNTNHGNKQGEPAIPEKYELKVPEGVTLNEDAVKEFTAIAKEMKMSQEQAQKFIDIQTKAALSHTEKINNEYQEQVDGWKKQSLEKFGANFKQEISYGHKFLDKFATPEVKEILISTGLANHPGILEMIIKGGKAIAEDRLVDGSQSGSQKSLADLIYTKNRGK